MEEDLTVLGTLRKQKLNEIEGYLRRCPNFVSSGFRPACEAACKICDGFRRLAEITKFFNLRDRMDRPEREPFSFFINVKRFLAFVKTLQSLVLDYVKSLKYGLGMLLSESLMPLLQYVYRDLVRTGLRDHLLGYTHGLSEEMSSFSTHLMYYLGMY